MIGTKYLVNLNNQPYVVCVSESEAKTQNSKIKGSKDASELVAIIKAAVRHKAMEFRPSKIETITVEELTDEIDDVSEYYNIK